MKRRRIISLLLMFLFVMSLSLSLFPSNAKAYILYTVQIANKIIKDPDGNQVGTYAPDKKYISKQTVTERDRKLTYLLYFDESHSIDNYALDIHLIDVTHNYEAKYVVVQVRKDTEHNRYAISLRVDDKGRYHYKLFVTAWPKHSIYNNKEPDNHGHINFSTNKAARGHEINITAHPDEGYVLKSLSVYAQPEPSHPPINYFDDDEDEEDEDTDYGDDEGETETGEVGEEEEEEEEIQPTDRGPAGAFTVPVALRNGEDNNNYYFTMTDSKVMVTAIFALAAQVTFADWDGTVLQSRTAAVGNMPIYEGETPQRPSTARADYTFTGWDRELSPVAGDITYTAVYSESLRSYDVTLSAENGTITADKTQAHVDELVTLTLTPESADCHLAGLTVRCGSQNVETTKVDETTRTFRMPAGDATAEAVFSNQDSVVYFINYGGDTLDWQSLYIGGTPADPAASEIPVRPADAQYTYTFAGWDRPIAPVTDEIEFYYATYTATVNSYPVRFEDWDGTVLQSSVEEYGTVPVYTGNQPARAADEQAVYAFRGWSPAIAAVTGESVFTADYDSTPFLRTGTSAIALTKEIANPAVGGSSYEYDCLFVPESDGYYLFESDGDDINPLIRILDGDNMIAYDYDSGGNWHFRLMQELEGGKTYTVRIESRESGALSLEANKVTASAVVLDQETEHGSISCETAEAYEGQRVFIILDPEEGYQLAELTVTVEDGYPVEVDIDSFIMPDCPVTVTARFEQPKPITAPAADEHIAPADISVNGLLVFDRENPAAVPGATVELLAGCEDGYIVGPVTVTAASGTAVPYKYTFSGISFIMPDEPVTVLLASQPAAFGTADLVLPADTVKVADRAFEEDVSIRSVEIPAGCTEIGSYAFGKCTNLRKIRIPAGCAVGNYAFARCGHVYIYGTAGSPAWQYCQEHSNCEFVEE